MLAAALTLWTLFSVWLAAPLIPLPALVPKVAAILLCAELFALFVYGYGTDDCDDPTCAPVAQAAGIAARTDLPALAGAFLALAVLRLALDGRRAAGPTR